MNPEDFLRKYLAERYMLQLATISAGQPWICTVYFVADAKLNLYWASIPSRRHSQEIANHAKTAAAIAVQHDKDKKVIGIQIEGDASIVESPAEIESIAKKYAEKFGRDSLWVESFVNLQTEHRLYKLVPRLFVLFDEVNFPHNTRLEWRPSS